eukprot:4023576-Pleurochrysis_carterae.AAC.4
MGVCAPTCSNKVDERASAKSIVNVFSHSLVCEPGCVRACVHAMHLCTCPLARARKARVACERF